MKCQLTSSALSVWLCYLTSKIAFWYLRFSQFDQHWEIRREPLKTNSEHLIFLGVLIGILQSSIMDKSPELHNCTVCQHGKSSTSEYWNNGFAFESTQLNHQTLPGLKRMSQIIISGILAKRARRCILKNYKDANKVVRGVVKKASHWTGHGIADI